jgi:hypothetical protein
MNDIDPARLEIACAHLGDAVIDPAMWPEMLGQISVAVGATGAVLLQSDVRTSDIPHGAGLSEMLNAYFGNEWHTRDLRANRSFPLILKGEIVIIDHDIVSPDEMERSPFYKELHGPHGLRWFAGIGFRAGHAEWGMSIQRSPQQGPFEAKDKRAWPFFATAY